MNDKVNTRNLVLTMLTETFDNGKLSNLVLNETYKKYALSVQDKKFLTRLYLGTLEKAVYLDCVIDNFSKTKTKKMKPLIRNIIRMGAYQILCMDSVPERAAISEALKLCDKRKISGLKGFVNGVLRTISQNAADIILPDYALASVPEWLYRKIEGFLGIEKAKAYFDAINNRTKGTTVRLVFSEKTEDKDEFKSNVVKSLEKDGCTVETVPEVFEALKISNFDALTKLTAFAEGKIIVQDLSSMLVAYAAKDEKNTDDSFCLIDVCAAPGGKSLHLAQIYPEAAIFAFDQNDYKISLIEENKKRLNIFNVKTCVHDSTESVNELENKADIVICDLPCSGLGTIADKPDIRTRLKENDFDELVKLQRKILKSSQKYVKKGGLLIYSTCTVNPSENIENADWFLKEYNFKSESLLNRIPNSFFTEEQTEELKNGYLQIVNGINNMDGFFISAFRKMA